MFIGYTHAGRPFDLQHILDGQERRVRFIENTAMVMGRSHRLPAVAPHYRFIFFLGRNDVFFQASEFLFSFFTIAKRRAHSGKTGAKDMPERYSLRRA